jgi:hypothetical protein
MWKNIGIRVSKKGRLCFIDICKILKINYNDYIDKISDNDKYFINDLLYVNESCAIIFILSIYNHSSVNFAATYLFNYVRTKVDRFNISKEKYCEYNDNKFLYFVIDGIKWYKAKDIAFCLGYKKTRNSIVNISKEFKCVFNTLKQSSLEKFYLLLHTSFIDPNTVFISHDGLIHFILKSDKPNAIDLAKFFNINVHQKFVRKEIEIVHELNLFCKSANIKSQHYFVYNKSKKYVLDYYLSEFDIAIVIDEFDHIDRDPKYEISRENFLKKHLHCKFIRCNPDDTSFSIASLIGKIHLAIINKIQ